MPSAAQQRSPVHIPGEPSGQTQGSQASRAEEGKAVFSSQWRLSSPPLFSEGRRCVSWEGNSVGMPSEGLAAEAVGAGPASRPPRASLQLLRDCRVPMS